MRSFAPNIHAQRILMSAVLAIAAGAAFAGDALPKEPKVTVDPETGARVVTCGNGTSFQQKHKITKAEALKMCMGGAGNAQPKAMQSGGKKEFADKVQDHFQHALDN